MLPELFLAAFMLLQDPPPPPAYMQRTVSGITVQDVDLEEDPNGAMRMTLWVDRGFLTLATVDGLTLVEGTGSMDTRVVFTGRLAEVNAAMATVTYTMASTTDTGIALLTVNANDQGYTGLGGPQEVTRTVDIPLPQVNQAPALAVPDGPDPEPDPPHPLGVRYASPDGSGDGTVDNPYSLQNALNAGAVQPGETLWLRGGVYYYPDRSSGVRGYEFSLQGTAEMPIVVRAYPGERATIDGGLRSHSSVYPRHLRIQDLEVTVSENLTVPRVSSQTGSNPTDLNRPGGGVTISAGHDLKLINNVIHANTGSGIGFWQSVSGNSELYGNLIYDNGWSAPDRNHGHGIYTQNGGTHEDWKYIRNNILLDNWSFSAQAYGSSVAYMDRYWVSENIYASGPHTQDGRFLIGGSRPSYLLRVYDNVSYYAAMQVGYSVYSGNRADDVEVTGNRIWAQIEFGEMTNFTHSDNFQWYQKYWAKPKYNGVTIDIPTTPYTFLYPNEYDTNRAHLAVQNFPDHESVAVDVSDFLAVGEDWELLDVGDFYGDPLQSGTCSGTTITIALDGPWLCGVLMNLG